MRSSGRKQGETTKGDDAVAKEGWIPATKGTVPPSEWILVRENNTGHDYWVRHAGFKVPSPTRTSSVNWAGPWIS